MPTSPNDIVQSDFVLPPKSDSFKAVPFGRCQLLSGTNSNAHTSYRLFLLFKFESNLIILTTDH